MINNKKIAITGESSGIGKAIYDFYSASNDCIGFSLEGTKQDLTVKETYNTCIDVIKDCDIFINNAYDRTYRTLQTDLLNDIFPLWKDDPNKAIITIGSTAQYHNRENYDYIKYTAAKLMIDNTIDRFKQFSHKCCLTVINPYFVRTKMFEHFLKENPKFVPKCVLETSDIVHHIDYILELFFKFDINIYRTEIRKKMDY